MNPIRVHFAGLRDDSDGEVPIDLVRALRLGGRPLPAGDPGPHEVKYDCLNRQAESLYAAAPLKEAEVVIYAYRAQDHMDELAAVSHAARERNLDCIFFSWGDADIPIDIPYGVVYRHSLVDGSRRPYERAMPAFCADPLNGAGVAPRSRGSQPTVGFCGFVVGPLRRLVYRLAGRAEKSAGLELRAKILRSLRRSPGVRTEFVCRNSYFAGTISRFHHDPAAQHVAWAEYLKNLLATDYNLCARGAGNFSYRFYEVLAAGRIPLFINTKCVLPFEGEIDWRNHCVWVEEDQIHRAGQILADFHSALTPQQFLDLQRDNRKLWEEYLSPAGFYRQLLSRSARQMEPIASSPRE